MPLLRVLKKIKNKLIGFNPSERKLKEIYDIFAKSPEGGWIIGWKEAKKIYHLIKVRDAKNALELGTGIGAAAAIMALAVEDSGKVTTIEQKKECLEIAKKLIPDNLQQKISFHLSEPCTFTSPILKQGERISGYKNLPVERGPFDFVLVDGPGSFWENGQMNHHPNGDLFNLISHIKLGGIVFVDNRKVALALYLKYLDQYFRPGGSWKNYCILEKIT